MARSSGRGSNLRLILMVLGLLVVIAIIVWLARSSGRENSGAPRPRPSIDLSLPKAPLPDGPKMPAPPIPVPK